MTEQTVIINGFSKSHAMTGWQLGYYTAPDPILQQVRKVQTHTVMCATSFAQHGACAALNESQEPVQEMRATYRERRDAAMDKLNTEGIEIPSPTGRFIYLSRSLPVKM
jgi:aspartate aminotransferase